jgi:hypothetical protein
MSAAKLVDRTILFSLQDSVTDLPLLGKVYTDVTVKFVSPGHAPISLITSSVNFRELGEGIYEYDLEGANLSLDGGYEIEFQCSGAYDYPVGLEVNGGVEYLLEKVFGFGSVVLTETYGGTVSLPKPLAVESGGVPLAGVRFYLFLASDYDTGNQDIATYAKGIGTSDVNGNWQWPIIVDPGDYVLIANLSTAPIQQVQEIVRFTAALPIATPAPTIITVAPVTGPATGGTLVSIIGTNFVDGCTVSFGADLSPSVSFISATLVKAIAPIAGAGVVDITVTNDDFQFGRKSSAFTYM